MSNLIKTSCAICCCCLAVQKDAESDTSDGRYQAAGIYLWLLLYWILYCTEFLSLSFRLTVGYYEMFPDCEVHWMIFVVCSPVRRWCQVQTWAWETIVLGTHVPFSVAAPTVWNSLPDNGVNPDTLATFKKWLKTHFFTASCETFLPPSASAFLVLALYKFYHCIVL